MKPFTSICLIHHKASTSSVSDILDFTNASSKYSAH